VEDQKKQIFEKIMAIPQNPDLKNISKDPSCWTMSSRNLSADMVISPSYHNFKIQCANIVSYLNKKPLDKLTEALEDIVTPNSNGIYILKGQGYAYQIHPEVIRYLKEII
jgi:hypothetical protein